LSVAFAPNGASVVSGGADASLNCWRVSDGALLWRVAGHGDWVMSVAFSPDGSTIASGSVDMTAKLWRASDGVSLRMFTGFGDAVNYVAYSPAGDLMTADWTRALKKWRTTDGALLATFAEGSLVNSICFTPDSAKFGYGLSDASVVLAVNGAGGGGTTTPALDAVVSTTKPSYVNREKATILVSVTDGAKAISGASVSVVVTSSKGTRTTLNGSTAANGVATLTYTVYSTKQGIGTYRVDASVTKSGYTSTTDSTTFGVTK
jgi:WD40 repeat protein